MEDLIKVWLHDLNVLKEKLYDIGDKSDSLQYNLLSTEALTLATCILGLQQQIINNNGEN
jgi:hypothetical protein